MTDYPEASATAVETAAVDWAAAQLWAEEKLYVILFLVWSILDLGEATIGELDPSPGPRLWQGRI